MVTFIDDDMPVIRDQIGDGTLPNQALHQSDIDNPGGFLLSAVDDTDLVGRQVKKRLETRDPLVEKLPVVDQDERIPSSHCDHLRRDNGLAKRSGCREHPGFVFEQGGSGLILAQCQHTREFCIQNLFVDSTCQSVRIRSQPSVELSAVPGKASIQLDCRYQ
jgi:hypothetical protein